MSKIPIHRRQISGNSNESDYLDIFNSLQDYLKLFLSILIILNFIIIFYVKFISSNSKKIKSFFSEDDDNKLDTENKENKKEGNENNNNNKKIKSDILFVIAHPDDEVMFFTPTLNNLLNKIDKLKYDINIRVLCLSNGNYDNIGKERENEFSRVMKNLRIEDYEILNDDRLQDDLYKAWDSAVVSEKINNYLSSKNEEGFNSVTHIITFDEDGVTKHPNHISCYEGIE